MGARNLEIYLDGNVAAVVCLDGENNQLLPYRGEHVKNEFSNQLNQGLQASNVNYCCYSAIGYHQLIF